MLGHLGGINQAAADSFCYRRAKDKGGNEIENRGPHHCQPGGKDAGGHNRGDAVGSIVEAIDEIERKCNQDGDNNQQCACVHLICVLQRKDAFPSFFLAQALLSTTPSRTLAASSALS